MDSLYSLKIDRHNYANFVSIVCKRGDIEVESAQKIVPPVIQYAADGSFEVLGIQEILSEVKTHPYKPNSSEFNAERLADLEVSNILKVLNHFPSLNHFIDSENKRQPHPLAKYIYSNTVYLRPTKECDIQLSKLSYQNKCKAIGTIMEALQKNLLDQKGFNIDLHSVPKHEVSKLCYIADKDGFGKVPKMFSFGFHTCVPSDRVAREISSIKSAEQFTNPHHGDLEIPEMLKPFTTVLRIAVVGTKVPTLDSGDMFKSALPKVECKLSREKIVKDLSTVPKENWNLDYRPFRSGVEIVHVEHITTDEKDNKPGTIRFIIPNGIKLAAQLQENQAYCSKGDIDLMISFDTVKSKGAVSIFSMVKENQTKELTVDDCEKIFRSLPKEKITWEDKEFSGYVLELPVFRPGQRYTELSKPTNRVSVDIIAKAILKKPYDVPKHKEEEYQEVRDFRQGIEKEIRKVATT